eukprot:scaffold1583_cov123-Skeletonema_dohrnii-CCMP3373.AAC.2
MAWPGETEESGERAASLVSRNAASSATPTRLPSYIAFYEVTYILHTILYDNASVRYPGSSLA